jgi:hypothetical protein
MHTTRIVKTQQTSDEAIAVTIRCCENPQTDSTVTIYGVKDKTSAQIDEKVSKHHDLVAAKCAGMQAAKQILKDIVLTPKVHA